MAADCAPDIEPIASLDGYRMVLDQARFHAHDDGHRDLRCFDRDTGEEVKLTWEINTDSGYVVTYAPPDPKTPFQRTLLKRHGRFVVYEAQQDRPVESERLINERLSDAQEEYRAAIEAQARLNGLPADQRIELTVNVVPNSGLRATKLPGDVERNPVDPTRKNQPYVVGAMKPSDNRQPTGRDSSDRFAAATRALSKS